jgi:glycosyltransferase involved in cell wall biosynthesis
MIRRLKLQEAVEVTGPLGPEELAREVARARICAAPLRRDLRNRVQGCSPIKLFEYMAAAKAIVSTDLPCVREILTAEETAALVHSPRPAQLAEQLLRLAGDEALASRLGARARAELMSHGTWAQRRAAIARVYAPLGGRSSNQAASAS